MQEYLHNDLKHKAILQKCGVNIKTTMSNQDSSILSCE